MHNVLRASKRGAEQSVAAAADSAAEEGKSRMLFLKGNEREKVYKDTYKNQDIEVKKQQERHAETEERILRKGRRVVVLLAVGTDYSVVAVSIYLLIIYLFTYFFSCTSSHHCHKESIYIYKRALTEAENIIRNKRAAERVVRLRRRLPKSRQGKV